MITVAELKGLAANKALSIGEAWNALQAAAERIEDAENWLRPIVERMRLEAHVHQRTDPIHAERLEAFAKDVESAFANSAICAKTVEKAKNGEVKYV